MRGATRMHDPSEAAHDRTRRRLMNVALVAILLATLGQLHWANPHQRTFLGALLLIVAGIPLGLAIKIFELRFKMAAAECRTVLRELPTRRKTDLILYGVLASVAFALQPDNILWPIWGAWLYDFVTYYHDRPERIRHLYTVTKILDELRRFPMPWLWPLPALAWEFFRMTGAH
jgi:hypothetical protein